MTIHIKAQYQPERELTVAQVNIELQQGTISSSSSPPSAWRQDHKENLIAPGGRDPPASPIAWTPKVDRDVPARWENRLQHSEMRPPETEDRIAPGSGSAGGS
jgi:hypothetical protein